MSKGQTNLSQSQPNNLNFSLEFEFIDLDKHRLAQSETSRQFTVSSMQQFGLQTDSRQMAVGTRQQESK